VEDVVVEEEDMVVAEMVDMVVVAEEVMVVVTKEDTAKVDMGVATRALAMEEVKEIIAKEVAMVVTVVDMVKEAMTRAKVVDMASLKAGVVDTARLNPSSSGEVKVNLLTTLAHMIRAMEEALQEMPLGMDSPLGLLHMEVAARVDMVVAAKEGMVEVAKVATVVARDTKFDRAPSNLGRGKMNVGPRTSVADIGLLGQADISLL